MINEQLSNLSKKIQASAFWKAEISHSKNYERPTKSRIMYMIKL